MLIAFVSVLCSALFDTGMSSFINSAMSSSFILMYFHLNVDNIYGLMMRRHLGSEEQIRNEEISEYDALITLHLKSMLTFLMKRKKIIPNYRKVNVEKMPFLVCNTINNDRFLSDVLIGLLFSWSCPCQMTGFQQSDKFVHFTLLSIKCMQVFLILKKDALIFCCNGFPVIYIQ